MNSMTRIVVAAVVLIICAGGGYLVGIKDFIAINALLHQHEQRAVKRTAQMDVITQELQILNIELQTERAKSTGLLSDIQSLTSKNAQLQAQLSIFKKVMTPEEAPGGVEVNSVFLQPLAGDNRYRLTVVLMQVGRRKPYISGSLKLSLSGLNAGIVEQIQYNKLISGEEEHIAFKFRYLSELETIFTVPDGFKPETLHMELSFRRGYSKRNHALEQNFDWNNIQQTPEYLN